MMRKPRKSRKVRTHPKMLSQARTPEHYRRLAEIRRGNAKARKEKAQEPVL
jgi:hypothetical protein